MSSFTMSRDIKRFARYMLPTALLIALTLIIWPACSVFAAETEPDGYTISVSGEYVQDAFHSGGHVFLFSRAKISEANNGNIWLFFSHMEVNTTIEGEIYSFFSDVRVNEGGSVTGGITTLGSATVVSEKADVAGGVESFLRVLAFLRGVASENGFTYYDDKLSEIAFLFSLMNIALVFLAAAIKKSAAEQGSAILANEPQTLIRNGLIGYLLVLLAIILFAASLFLLPLSLLLFLLLYALMMLGEASLSMFIGNSIMQILGVRLGSWKCLGIGVLLIEGVRNLPYLSYALNTVVIPILTFGTALTILGNAMIHKRFYTPDFEDIGAAKTGFKAAQGILRGKP